MMFKFGLLVLLLALDDAFAVEQQPTLPDVDVVSYLQQLKQHDTSALRMHHSEIQGPLLTSFGFFMQSAWGTCAWSMESGKCSISSPTVSRLLKSSSTDFANIAQENMECLDRFSESACNRHSCLYIDRLLECVYAYPKRGHEDSPCAKAAPKFFNLAQISMRSSECASCKPNIAFLLTGIETFNDKANQVMDSVADTIATEYDAFRHSTGFTWQSYLDYTPSHITCPSGVESLVCAFVEILVRRVSGPYFYCRQKYERWLSGCNADAVCTWNTTSAECGMSEARSLEASSAAMKVPSKCACRMKTCIQVIFDATQEGVDKTFLDNLYKCDRITTIGSCQGNCIWNPLHKQCEVKTSLIANLLTEASGDSSDGLCRFIKVVYSAPCYSQFTKRDCHNVEFCRWTSEAGCVNQPELLLSAAAELDPALKDEYTEAKKKCSGGSDGCSGSFNTSSRIKFSPWTLLLVCLFIHLILVLY